MILGISIDENYVYVCENGDTEIKSYPFAIGRNLSNNTWFIGDEAKSEIVDNVDIVIDKLYYIMGNDGEARIGEVSYTAKELVRIFFNNLLSKYINIDYVTVVVRQNNIKILSKIKYALSKNLSDSKFKVSTYSEAFVSYIKSKDKDYYSNTVSLFNFTEKALTYYELLRYRSKDNHEYWKVNIKDHLALPLDLLSGDAGKRVCDNLLLDFAKKCLKEEVYGNIVLSGVGFSDVSSYREFMTYVCILANVETDVDFFAKSAYLLSNDILNDNFDRQITLFTDSRTDVSVKLNAVVNHENTKIELIKPGEEWFNIYNNSFDVIVDNERDIRFEILKVIEGVVRDYPVAIPDNMELRSDKTNLFEISLLFLQQNLLQITLTDKGFGAFYESKKTFTNISVDV